MKIKSTKMLGVTLIEILLVLVIASAVIYMIVGYVQQKALQARVDRTAIQMQQLLNASLAYYVSNGKWPPTNNNNSIKCFYGEDSPDNTCDVPYIPQPFSSPWAGEDYYLTTDKDEQLVYIYVNVKAGGQTSAVAQMIAGKLPLAYVTNSNEPGDGPPPPGTNCNSSATSCYVVASVNIPGQNLNNAAAVNFAGVYHHGACVPMPNCPEGTIPRVIISPVSLSGVNEIPNDPNDNPDVYPISSFTAYATGDPDNPSNSPPLCQNSDDVEGGNNCNNDNIGEKAPGYWRACVQIVTDQGDVAKTNDGAKWGEYVTLLAITRCAIKNEPAGSSFDVYSN